MLKYILFILFLGITACAPTYKNDYSDQKLYVGDPTPKLSANLQIQDNENILGYAQKYSWENYKGIKRNHYFISDKLGNLIGYVGPKGETKIYLPNGNIKKIGTFLLENACPKIFNVEQKLFILPAGSDIIPVEEDIVIVDTRKASKNPYTRFKRQFTSKPKVSKTKKSKKITKPKEKKQEIESEQWPGPDEPWPFK